MKLRDNLKNTHPLWENEIKEFLDDNDIFPYKVYARNDPKIIIPSGEFFCVINLDSSEGTGTHWTGMYSNEDTAYYYDPYGMPCPTEIIDWVKNKNKMRLFYIDNQHQPNLSALCGYYVCYFLYQMDAGMDIEKFMEQFDDNGDEGNDLKLLDYMGIRKKAGKGFDLVEKLNKLLPNTELHMRDIKFNDYGLPVGLEKHNFTGPNTNLKERISNIDELMALPRMEDITYDRIKYITPPIDESIDRYASIHDLQYSWGERNAKDPDTKLKDVHRADEILQRNAYKTMRDGKAPIQKRIQGALVSLTMMLKRKIGLGATEEEHESAELVFLGKHMKDLNKKQVRILNALKRKK